MYCFLNCFIACNIIIEKFSSFKKIYLNFQLLFFYIYILVTVSYVILAIVCIHLPCVSDQNVCMYCNKVRFYIAQYPVRSLFLSWQTCSLRHQLGFSWKHSSHAAIAQRLFTHMSTTVYSQVLIYTAESTEAS